MHHLIEKKKANHAYTLKEVAALCGMSVGSVQWHKMKGRLPKGEVPVGRFSFYSERQLLEIKRFFAARGIWEHMP